MGVPVFQRRLRNPKKNYFSQVFFFWGRVFFLWDRNAPEKKHLYFFINVSSPYDSIMLLVPPGCYGRALSCCRGLMAISRSAGTLWTITPKVHLSKDFAFST